MSTEPVFDRYGILSNNTSGINASLLNTPGALAGKASRAPGGGMSFRTSMATQEELLSLLARWDLTKLDLAKLSRNELITLQKLLTPRTNKYFLHVPTEKQTAFLLLDCKEAFYGGAAGGGKSDALLMCALQFVDVKNYAAIIFRKTFADLTKPNALIDRSREWLHMHDDVKWDDKNKKWDFLHTYGPHKEIWSVIQFGYLETTKDKYNYQGGEYQFIGFDELTHIDLSSYLYLFSRLRRLKGFQAPLRVRGASNPPDDDMGLWVKTRFVDEGIAKGRVFIRAGMHDNPFLDLETYHQNLAELDPVTRRRLEEGDWDVVRRGNTFKRDWFEEVDSIPVNRRRVRFWDMAATDPDKAAKKNRSKDPDYTVGFLMSEAEGVYYIEDILRVRKRPSVTEKIQRYCAISDGFGTLIREEQEGGSSGLTAIEMKAKTIFRGYNYDGIRSTGNKTTRAQGVSAAAERGQIKILRSCRNKEKFYGEMESFPGGIHDDMVDGLSGAFTELGVAVDTGYPIEVNSDNEDHWLDEVNSYEDADTFAAGYFSSFG